MLNINSTGKNYRFYIVNGYDYWTGKEWTDDIRKAKSWKTENGALKAAIRVEGGEVEELRPF